MPMTEEEDKLLEVRARHRSMSKEVSARVERRKELLKRRYELLFQRRCLAVRLSNRIVALRTDADHIRHQRLVGWKYGNGMPMPEEILNCRNRIGCALELCAAMGNALDAGLDAFLVDYQQQKSMCPEVHTDLM